MTFLTKLNAGSLLDADVFSTVMSGLHSAGAEETSQGCIQVGGKEAVWLAEVAAQFEDVSFENMWIKRAAKTFRELREVSLSKLPARLVARLLGDETLVTESEDDVYEAALAYVRERGASITFDERRDVWAKVRFGLCSEQVKEKLLELECAKELSYDWLRELKTCERKVRING